MNTVFILIFAILASSQSEPDTNVNIHLPPEESKGDTTQYSVA